MSLSSAMQAGLSGLNANSTALSTAADNIANVNTVGFKQSQTTFESLVTGSGADSADSSGGVLTHTAQLVTQQGQPIQTSSPTDLAISGQGFFVVTAQPGPISSSNQSLFTRAGSFTENKNGFLVNSAGFSLQGWPANAQGVITPNPSNLTSLQPINVSQLSGAVAATTTVSLSANLDSGQTVSAAATAVGPPATAGAYNASTNSMAMFETNNATGVKPDFSIPIPISDSEGQQRTVQLDLLKSATPNQWYAELIAVPPSSVVDGAGLTDGQVGTGIVAFTPSGQFDPTNTTLLGGANPQITLGASNAGAPAAGAVNWAAGLGIASQKISLNFASALGGQGVTQFASQSAIQSINTNGTPFGAISNVAINSAGIVSAVFSNGITQTLGQVSLATFPNPDGLTAVSGNAFQSSEQSGNFTLEQPGQGGSGTLDPSALESSTVDLSTQLTSLITSQTAYSASSKIITTANQMMQTLLNVIQ
ncbi:MAG: flagellar hook-basal body complex protein [Caulobacteraceae bacterium]